MLETGVRMLLVDAEADDFPALRFFQEMGFTNPQQHVYLTLNLTTQRRMLWKKKKNIKAQTKSHRKDHE